MNPTRSFAALIALALALPATAQDEPQEAPSPGEIVQQAAAEEWFSIAPSDLLVMTLEPGPTGNPREIVIQLMPAPFSRGWVDNIRTLARAGWYDGISINRVQDNYVVQWGDPHGEDAAKAKPLPQGLRVMSEDEYLLDADALGDAATDALFSSLGNSQAAARDAEMAKAAEGLDTVFADPTATEAEIDEAISDFLRSAGLDGDEGPSPSEEVAMISIASTQTPTAPEGWHQRDSTAEWVEFWQGWPIANKEVGTWYDADGSQSAPPTVPKHEAYAKGMYQEVQESWFWPVHCYGMVGVGRGMSPDTGSGAELYTVIGHAPRHLDRNIALVGRVIEGIEHLSILPRGTGPLGFYESAEERVPIRSIRLASDLPPAEQPQFVYLSTESESFARYTEARANRRDPFFIQPAGGTDICNIPVPVRRASDF